VNIFELGAIPEVHEAWLAYDKARRSADAAYEVWKAALQAAMAAAKEQS
jgi:hypothetical protein